ncbi:MAG TPA: YafY family protein [Myxococcota bacterium]|nr:YafY family protein [Myxococcota bacterium]
MRRADRLFRLVQLLRARRFATGEQIASELGVSKRTVYRDVADLQGSGVPIRGEAGVGYRLERGYELAPLIFTSDELAGLVLGARIVASFGDPDLAAAVASAMTKVEAVLPEGLRRVVLETPLFAPGRPWSAAMAGEVAMLRRAISERRLVHFKYGREDGVESERDARPLGLYFWGRKWTLAAWCELRADYRSFRPDRMRELMLLDRTFDPDADGISLAGFVAKGDPADWESWEWRREAAAPPDPTSDTLAVQAAGAPSFANERSRAGRDDIRSM